MVAATGTINIQVSQQGAQQVQRSIEDIGRGADAAASSIRLLQGILATVGVGSSLSEIVRQLGAFQGMQNQIQSVTDGLNVQAAAFERLAEVANAARQPLEAHVQLYQRISFAAADLKLSQEEIIRVTQAVGAALTIQNADAQQARIIVNELSRAFVEGTVTSRDWMALIRNAPQIIQLMAKAIHEMANTDAGFKMLSQGMQAADVQILKATGSTAALKYLLDQGKISSEVFTKALLQIQPALQTSLDKLQRTIPQAFVVLQNNLDVFIGRLGAATGANAALANAILAVADNLPTVLKYAEQVGAALLVAFGPAILAAVVRLSVAIAAFAITNPWIALVAGVSVALAKIDGFRASLESAVALFGGLFGGLGALILDSLGTNLTRVVEDFKAGMGAVLDYMSRGISVVIAGLNAFRAALGFDVGKGSTPGTGGAATSNDAFRKGFSDTYNYITQQIEAINKAWDSTASRAEKAGRDAATGYARGVQDNLGPFKFQGTGGQQGPTPSGAALDANEKSNAQQITMVLQGLDATNIAIAGMLAGIKAESGFDPTRVNKESGAANIAQWLGPRLEQLKSIGDTKSLATGLQMMEIELRGRYAPVLAAANAAATPSEAARIWMGGPGSGVPMGGYESPLKTSDPRYAAELKKRQDWAESFYRGGTIEGPQSNPLTNAPPAGPASMGSKEFGILGKLNDANEVAKARRELEDYNRVVEKAAANGLLVTNQEGHGNTIEEEKARLLGIVTQKLWDQVDPLSALLRPLQEQVKYMDLLDPAERKAAEAVDKMAEQLRKQGTLFDTQKIRGYVTEQEHLKAVSTEMETVWKSSSAGALVTFNNKLEALDRLLKAGAITVGEYTDAWAKAKADVLEKSDSMFDGIEAGLLRVSEKLGTEGKIWSDAVGAVFTSTENWIDGLVSTGKAKFSDLAKSITADLTKAAFKGALHEAFGLGGGAEGGSKGGLLGSIFGLGAGTTRGGSGFGTGIGAGIGGSNPVGSAIGSLLGPGEKAIGGNRGGLLGLLFGGGRSDVGDYWLSYAQGLEAKGQDVKQGLLDAGVDKQALGGSYDYWVNGEGGGPLSGLKFAYGGQFHVPGQGGTDTVPVQFMATPGERVTVETPTQQAGSRLNGYQPMRPGYAGGGEFDVPSQFFPDTAVSAPTETTLIPAPGGGMPLLGFDTRTWDLTGRLPGIAGIVGPGLLPNFAPAGALTAGARMRAGGRAAAGLMRDSAVPLTAEEAAIVRAAIAAERAAATPMGVGTYNLGGTRVPGGRTLGDPFDLAIPPRPYAAGSFADVMARARMGATGEAETPLGFGSRASDLELAIPPMPRTAAGPLPGATRWEYGDAWPFSTTRTVIGDTPAQTARLAGMSARAFPSATDAVAAQQGLSVGGALLGAAKFPLKHPLVTLAGGAGGLALLGGLTRDDQGTVPPVAPGGDGGTSPTALAASPTHAAAAAVSSTSKAAIAAAATQAGVAPGTPAPQGGADLTKWTKDYAAGLAQRITSGEMSLADAAKDLQRVSGGTLSEADARSALGASGLVDRLLASKDFGPKAERSKKGGSLGTWGWVGLGAAAVALGGALFWYLSHRKRTVYPYPGTVAYANLASSWPNLPGAHPTGYAEGGSFDVQERDDFLRNGIAGTTPPPAPVEPPGLFSKLLFGTPDTTSTDKYGTWTTRGAAGLLGRRGFAEGGEFDVGGDISYSAPSSFADPSSFGGGQAAASGSVFSSALGGAGSFFTGVGQGAVLPAEDLRSRLGALRDRVDAGEVSKGQAAAQAVGALVGRLPIGMAAEGTANAVRGTYTLAQQLHDTTFGGPMALAPGSPEMARAATEGAMSVATLGMGVGGLVRGGGAGSVGGMFVGSKAEGSTGMLAASRDLKAGMSAADVWAKHGWAPGSQFADRAWRSEISDANAKVIGAPPVMGGGSSRLGDVLHHPELYAAYPQIADIPVFQQLEGGSFGPKGIGAGFGQGAGPAQSTLLHEAQHVVQRIEGFGRGASPAEVLSRGEASSTMEAHELYRRTSGEVEARLTEARAGLTSTERLANPPWEAGAQFGPDVPKEWQIYRNEAGDMLSESRGRGAGAGGSEFPGVGYLKYPDWKGPPENPGQMLRAMEGMKENPTKQWLRHAANAEELKFFLRNGSVAEKSMASRELAIADRKMDYWKNVRSADGTSRWDQQAADTGMKAIQDRWASAPGPAPAAKPLTPFQQTLRTIKDESGGGGPGFASGGGFMIPEPAAAGSIPAWQVNEGYSAPKGQSLPGAAALAQRGALTEAEPVGLRERSFLETLGGLAGQFGSFASKALFGGDQGLFGGAPLLSGMAKGGTFVVGWDQLRGYAGGGEFDVGGFGGTDSQLVAFKASPGEHVDVTPPSNVKGGFGTGQTSAGNTTVHNWNITTPDPEGFRRSHGQIAAMTGAVVDRQTRRNN